MHWLYNSISFSLCGKGGAGILELIPPSKVRFWLALPYALSNIIAIALISPFFAFVTNAKIISLATSIPSLFISPNTSPNKSSHYFNVNDIYLIKFLWIDTSYKLDVSTLSIS